jgi:DnaJ-class molecular chaperone
MSVETRADYYEILGVARTATGEEIKRAYRSRARELHPDTSGGPDTDAAFVQLNDAYRVLSRASSRFLYDLFGSLGSDDSLDDRVVPADAVAQVELDVEEARRGTECTVEYWDGTACPECDGRGWLAGDPCPRCDGGGRIATARTERVYIPAGVRSGEAVALDDEGVVLVRVRGEIRDSALVRALAFVGFLATLAILVYLLLAP